MAYHSYNVVVEQFTTFDESGIFCTDRNSTPIQQLGKVEFGNMVTEMFIEEFIRKSRGV